MKKWKNVISLIIVIALILNTGLVFATEDRVEIVFCVGDDALLINGTTVTVEKPYVVGEGVTLVPLRVITEAFGATVDWDDATQSITLTYPGVSIFLQIDNPIAEVNGKAEMLLAAPELPTSHTMVPLRFISETFGAVVSYDEETEQITVVKEKIESNGMLEGAVDSKNIGDSYYNWIMEKPLNMQMVERTFDGTYTAFENEIGCLEIIIESVPSDYNFEKDFVDGKSSLMGTTLVKAEKDDSNAQKRTMHFQAKSKETFVNIRYIVSKEYSYMVYGVFDSSAIEEKDEAIRIMDTFDLGYFEEETYDLSNVQDGVRRFIAEDLNISIEIPQNYYQIVSEGMLNVFRFVSMDPEDDISSISFGVYSKGEVGDAKSMAENDYQRNKSDTNEQISTFSDGVTENSYGDISVFEYDITTKKTSGEEYMRDVFFSLGDYTYNVSISANASMEDVDAYVDEILNSVTIELIDFDKVGILMRNFPDATGTYMVTMADATLEIPNNYIEEQGDNISLYNNRYNGVGITFQRVEVEGGRGGYDMTAAMRKMESQIALQSKNSILESTKIKTIGDYKFATFAAKTVEDNEALYIQEFGIYRNGAIYVFVVVYPELSYSEKSRQEVLDIIKSLKF